MYDRSYIEKEAIKCSGCGTCLRFCPIFKEAGKETISPKGKALLIRSYLEEDLPLSRYLEQIFSQCLLCHGCKDLCSPGIEVNRLVLGMRAVIAEKKGLPIEKRLVFERLLKI